MGWAGNAPPLRERGGQHGRASSRLSQADNYARGSRHANRHGRRAVPRSGRRGVKEIRNEDAYDPAAMFELKVCEVEFRRTPAGRQLMARIYQPQGTGPFPTVLDLHGGAWRRKDRLAEEPMDGAIAASGVLVVAIDLRLSEEAPYPASVH